MDRWKNRIVLITGASSGIGATICKLLSQNGMKVVGCARRFEKMEEMKDRLLNFYPYKVRSKIWIHSLRMCNKINFSYKCDMRNEDEIREMFVWIENHPDLGKIDVCIPNAGLNQDSNLMDGNIL